jgi:hypothetical protein
VVFSSLDLNRSGKPLPSGSGLNLPVATKTLGSDESMTTWAFLRHVSHALQWWHTMLAGLLEDTLGVKVFLCVWALLTLEVCVIDSAGDPGLGAAKALDLSTSRRC